MRSSFDPDEYRSFFDKITEVEIPPHIMCLYKVIVSRRERTSKCTSWRWGGRVVLALLQSRTPSTDITECFRCVVGFEFIRLKFLARWLGSIRIDDSFIVSQSRALKGFKFFGCIADEEDRRITGSGCKARVGEARGIYSGCSLSGTKVLPVLIPVKLFYPRNCAIIGNVTSPNYAVLPSWKILDPRFSAGRARLAPDSDSRGLKCLRYNRVSLA